MGNGGVQGTRFGCDRLLENGFHINNFVGRLVQFAGKPNYSKGFNCGSVCRSFRRLQGSKLMVGGVCPTSALVLHFRTVDNTLACLDSVWGQGVDQAMLVDNSEDDGMSLGALGPGLQALRAKGMSISVLEPGRNLGFSAGVNRGLAAIRQTFGAVRVLLLNSDAQLKENALSQLQSAIDEGAGIVAPLLDSPDGSSRSVAYYHRFSGLIFGRHWPGSFPHLSGCCLLLSESVAESELLNEKFFFYGEDAFLGWKSAHSGVVARVVPTARVLHLGSGSSRRGSLFYEYHMARAHLQLARELASSRKDFWFLLLGRCIWLPLRALWRVLRQRSSVPILGLAMAGYDFSKGRVRNLTPPAEGRTKP